MNKGTKDLQQLVEIFNSMTVEEYERLYDEVQKEYNGTDFIYSPLEPIDYNELSHFLDGGISIQIDREYVYSRQVIEEPQQVMNRNYTYMEDDKWERIRMIAA